MNKIKSIIYYTNNILDERIFKEVQKSILRSGLSIVSCSLKPIDFGENIVLDLKPSMITMFRQILIALENSKSIYIFFCEHDVLYHKSHFDFIPPENDVYYYNTNVWRWDYPQNRLITYEGLKSLSGLCCNRKLAIKHYKKRLEYIKERNFKDGRDPNWARKIGYEPGKNRRRGGFIEEKTGEWKSEFPLIDIRHKYTLTPRKVTLKSFRHQPIKWEEIILDKVEGWNLKELFNL